MRESRRPWNNIISASPFFCFSNALKSYVSHPSGEASFAVRSGMEKLLISCSMIPIICNSCMRHRGLHRLLPLRLSGSCCSQYDTSNQCGRAYVQFENNELLSVEKEVDRLPRESRSRVFD